MELSVENILTGLSLLLVVLGVIGSVAPALPGSVLSWIGIFILKFTSYGEKMSWIILILLLLLVIINKILDYLVPLWGVKKLGGSKYGMYGSIIGLIIGMFFPPLGFLIGSFAGAFLGEVLINKTKPKTALKASFGTVGGMLLTSGIGLFVTLIHLAYFLYLTYPDMITKIDYFN